MGENIIMLVCFLPCPMIFTLIGLVAWRRKTPMHFWSGSKVLPEEVTDVKAYNHAYALMWFVYTIPYWISTILVLKNRMLAGIILGVWALFGTIAMVAWYTMWIEKKYKWKYVDFHQSLKAEQEKRAKIISRKRTKFEKNMDKVSLVIFLVTAVWIAAMWKFLPEKIPSHFNGLGDADAWSGRGILIFDLSMQGILYLMMTATEKMQGIWNVPQKKTEEQQAQVYEYAGKMIAVLKLAVVLIFGYITICSGLGRELGGWFLWGSLGATFIPMGYYIYKMY